MPAKLKNSKKTVKSSANKTVKLRNVNVAMNYEKQIFTLYTLVFLNLFLMLSLFLSITGRVEIGAKQVLSSLILGYVLTSLIFKN